MSRNLIFTSQVRDASNTPLTTLLTNVNNPTITANANSSVSIGTNNSIVLANANDASLVFTLGYANAVNYVTVKKIDGNVNSVTVQANGSQTIDGSANIILTQKSSVSLVNDGANSWFIV